MSNDDYLGLSGHDRAVLHGLWLEYASSRCRLRLDTVSLSRRLNLRVTTATLERLNHAGFIEFVASSLLADGYHVASPEVEVEKETPKPPTGKPQKHLCPECRTEFGSLARLTEHRLNVHHVEPLQSVA